MFLSSLLFFFSVSRSFHYFFFLLARSVHSLPLIHVPFLGFLLYCTLLIISINLLVVFPFISSPPSSLSAPKDDASDKMDGKIISLCFTCDNLLMLSLFSFLLFHPHLLPVHFNSFSCSVWPQRPLLSLSHSILIHITTQHISSLLERFTYLRSSPALLKSNLVDLVTLYHLVIYLLSGCVILLLLLYAS